MCTYIVYAWILCTLSSIIFIVIRLSLSLSFFLPHLPCPLTRTHPQLHCPAKQQSSSGHSSSSCSPVHHTYCTSITWHMHNSYNCIGVHSPAHLYTHLKLSHLCTENIKEPQWLCTVQWVHKNTAICDFLLRHMYMHVLEQSAVKPELLVLHA